MQAEEPRSAAFQPGEWLNAQASPVRFSILGAAAFAAVTLAVAVVNTLKKSRSPDAQRKRTVNKNKMVVEGIDEYLPERRQELTPGEGHMKTPKETYLLPWVNFLGGCAGRVRDGHPHRM